MFLLLPLQQLQQLQQSELRLILPGQWSAWSNLIGRGISRLCSHWLLRQLSYAIKNQLVAGTQRIELGVFCLLLAGSLWHKKASMHGKVLL